MNLKSKLTLFVILMLNITLMAQNGTVLTGTIVSATETYQFLVLTLLLWIHQKELPPILMETIKLK